VVDKPEEEGDKLKEEKGVDDTKATTTETVGDNPEVKSEEKGDKPKEEKGVDGVVQDEVEKGKSDENTPKDHLENKDPKKKA